MSALGQSARQQIIAEMNSSGVSRMELARRMGVSQPYVSQMLHPRSNLTLRTLERICAAIGVPVSIAINP